MAHRGDDKTKGICYKRVRIEPLENNITENVFYKTDRYAELFGRGKDCSYFPGYGKIYNRCFEIWYQDFGTKDKKNISEYQDIGAEYLPPLFTEEKTGYHLINNELKSKQTFLKLFNIRDEKKKLGGNYT